MSTDKRLAGKVAVITGASTGCGPVMGKLFVEQGAKVLMSARRVELVEEAAREIGPGAIAMRCDVTSEEDVKAMVARAMNEFGQIDILLNNAAAPGTALSDQRGSLVPVLLAPLDAAQIPSPSTQPVPPLQLLA